MDAEPAARSSRATWLSDRDLEARAGSLATVNAIADTVYRYLDFTTLVEHAADVILQYIPVESVVLFTLDDSGQWLNAAASRGFDEETLRVGSRLPINGSATGVTVTRREITTDYALNENTRLEPNVKQELIRQGLTGFISVPLLFQEKAVGALNLIFHEKHTLTPLEYETLMAVGKTIGLAIVNAQHVNRIEAEIAERRRVEAELRRYQEHLEELVTVRTAALESANLQLRVLVDDLQAAETALRDSNLRLQDAQRRTERASQAKTTFLSNMSHELRTPLNVIIGYTSSMLNQSPIYNNIPLADLYRKDIQLVLDNGYYLLDLINDVLDLSKIEAGKFVLNCAAVSLTDVFKGVIATAIGLLQDKPIQIRSHIPDDLPLVWADAVRVRQILLNLLSNAIKFTAAGTVTIQAEMVDNKVRIAVTDTGIGIPAEALSSIFDRFQQAEADISRQYGGTGLGLDISRQLVRLHNGELTAHSVVGKGSNFSFTLAIAPDQMTPALFQPISGQHAIRVFEPSIAADESQSALILIVAPSAEQVRQWQQVIDAAGYLSLVTHEPDRAIGMARDLIPDLIMLAGIDRCEMEQALRDNPETAAIPVLSWTAADPSENNDSVLAAIAQAMDR